VHQRLQQRLQAARKADGGFTLIELLIVIVILGVLAGVVVFSVQAINDRGKSAACKTNLKSVETAAAAWYAEHANTWPANGDGITNIAPSLVTDPNNAAVHYLKEAPAGYTYTIDTSGTVTSTPGC
jgi:prepilin-type N-terminal cleavage/methylation domain-containing protein